MNQSDINGILLCLSRMTTMVVSNNNQHSNNSFGADSIASRDLHDHHHNDEDHDHDHDHDHEENSNEVVMAKATAMLVLFCATSICGAAPFILNRFFNGNLNNTNSNANARSATLVKCLLYFGGGVLLCTTFLHLLPEVRETVEGLQECGAFPKLSFPLVELLMCAGFFFMFLIEELIHSYIHRNKHEQAGAAFERGHSIRHSYVMRHPSHKCQDDNETQMFDECATSNNNTSGSGTIKSLTRRDLYCSDIEDQKNHHQHNSHQRAPSATVNTTTAGSANPHNFHSHNHHSHSYGHSHFPVNENSDTTSTAAAAVDDIIKSSLRGLLIVLALSVHELFEGLAIGLEGSASNVWFMFAAVSAHKLVLAFCVGVELIVAHTKTYLSVLFVFTFAVVSPIGIGIGMLVSNQDSTASSIPSAILQGLACGTLLYVVFFEILSKDRSGLLAYLAIILGFCLMFGLQRLVSGHQHSHGGGCAHSEDSQVLKQDDNHRHLDSESLSLEQQLQMLREASLSLKQIVNKN